jgi:Insertion element 4 transposase N-terminal
LNDCAMVTAPCLVTVAAGVLAPGHPGELTRYLPFELADDVLESTGTVQKRMRALPSRVGLYFVLAMTLFPGIGYLKVWDKMTAALEDLGLARLSEKALRDLRRRLGPAPARAMFETVAVPLASPWTRGVTWRGLRTVAFDGLNSVKVPELACEWLRITPHEACVGIRAHVKEHGTKPTRHRPRQPSDRQSCAYGSGPAAATAAKPRHRASERAVGEAVRTDVGQRAGRAATSRGASPGRDARPAPPRPAPARPGDAQGELADESESLSAQRQIGGGDRGRAGKLQPDN